MLTAVALELELLRMDSAARGDGETPERVKKVTSLLECAFERVRGLSYEFHPDPVGKFGFYSAVDRLVQCFQQRYPGRLHSRLDRSVALPETMARGLYEILECLLDNVLEAPYSSEVRISTTRTGGGLTLIVSVPEGPQREFAVAVGRVTPLAIECGIECQPEAPGRTGSKVRFVCREERGKSRRHAD
jgi:signal transduction histidine kinase